MHLAKLLNSFVILVVLLSCYCPTQAQLESYHKLFQSEHFTTCFDIAPTLDQGYIMTGFEDRPQPFDMPLVPFLCKIDCRGEVEWMHKYGQTTMLQNTDPRVTVLDDRGYAMMTSVFGQGMDILVVQTDAEGNANWKNTYGGEGDEIGRGLLKLDDGNLLVVGYTGSYGTDIENFYSDMYAVKISSKTGDTIWTKSFGNPDGLDHLWDVSEASNGDLTFMGRTFFEGGIWMSLIRTDSEGNTEWIKNYGKTNHQTSGIDMIEMPDGGFSMTGITTIAKADFNAFSDAFVVRTDVDGNILWTKVYHGTSPDLGDSASSILLKGDSLIISVESTSYPDPNADISKRMIYILDQENGTLLKATSYNGSGGQFPIIRKDWNGFIMSGFTDEFEGSWNDPIVLKLDQDLDSGCQELDWTESTQTEEPKWDEVPGSFTISSGGTQTKYETDSIGTNFVTSTLCFKGEEPADCEIISSTSSIAHMQALKVYPNPTSGEFMIENLQSEYEAIDITIYDVLGQQVEFSSVVNSNIIHVDINQLASGTYFVHALYDQKSSIYKIEKH